MLIFHIFWTNDGALLLLVRTFPWWDTHLINMLMPVVSIARLMPFHDATMEYFWRAVRGRRGSGADGAGGSLTLLSTSFLLSPLLANLPSSHPMAKLFPFCFTQAFQRPFLFETIIFFDCFLASSNLVSPFVTLFRINLKRHFLQTTHLSRFVCFLLKTFTF